MLWAVQGSTAHAVLFLKTLSGLCLTAGSLVSVEDLPFQDQL